VGLLRAAPHQPGPPGGAGRPLLAAPQRCRTRRTRQPVAEGRGDQVQHLLVLHPAGRGDHDRGDGVAPAVPAVDVVPGQGLDGLDRAQHRPAQGGAAEQRLGEQVVHQVGGFVVAHGDLLEHHRPLALQVRGRVERVGDQVAEQGDGQRQVAGEHVGVVAGVLLGGEGVHLTTHGVHGRRDLQRAATAGPLEQQVLEEVRGAGDGVGLVPRAHAHPDADGRRQHPGHRLGQHAQATGQFGALDPAADLVDVQDDGLPDTGRGRDGRGGARPGPGQSPRPVRGHVSPWLALGRHVPSGALPSHDLASSVMPPRARRRRPGRPRQRRPHRPRRARG
jgi:hypothetical protein